MLRRLPLPLPLLLLLLFVLLHMYACACAWRILAELRSLCCAACAGMCVLFPKHSTSCCVDCTATVMFCCLTVALRLLFLPFLFFYLPLSACRLLSIARRRRRRRPRVPKNALTHTHTSTHRQTRFRQQLLHCCCRFDLNCPARHTHTHTQTNRHVYLTHVIPFSLFLPLLSCIMHFWNENRSANKMANCSRTPFVWAWPAIAQW